MKKTEADGESHFAIKKVLFILCAFVILSEAHIGSARAEKYMCEGYSMQTCDVTTGAHSGTITCGNSETSSSYLWSCIDKLTEFSCNKMSQAESKSLSRLEWNNKNMICNRLCYSCPASWIPFKTGNFY